MKNEEKTYDLFKFEDGDFSLDIMVSFTDNTIWLTQEQISILFGKAKSTINEHIKNIFSKNSLSLKYQENSEKPNCLVQKTHIPFSDKPVKIYSLEVVTEVGNRVKSKRGTLLKMWADSILNNTSINDDYNIQNMPRISERFELVKFEDGDFSLDVNVSPEEDTVWLTANQMALLFDRDEKTIRKHINNVFKMEKPIIATRKKCVFLE